MRKRPLIQAVGQDEAVENTETLLHEAVATETSPEDEERLEEEWDDDAKPARSLSWVVPALALLAVAGWTAFYGWAHLGEIVARPTAGAWTDLIARWATPVLLVVALWLLAMRNSTREARRFAAVGQALSVQSGELECRLATVNRELSLAREFLSSQTKDLDYLGRSATERLSAHADRLQALIGENGEQVESIARVSVTALENMDKLRGNLPVIANSAKDVSNQIGSAGRSAQAQLEDLIRGFERLNEFGVASERQIGALGQTVDGALDAFETRLEDLTALATERFEVLRENSESFRGDLDSREVEALASIRARFEALRVELAETDAAASREREAVIDALRTRLEALRSGASDVSETVRHGETEALAAWEGQIEAMQDRLQNTIAEIQRIDQTALTAANTKLKELFVEAERVDARLTERNRVFVQETGRRQAQFAAQEESALAALTLRLETVDRAIAERREAQARQLDALAVEGEALAERIAALGETFETVSDQGREARTTLAAGIDALNAKLGDSRESLDGTDMAVAALTDASVRLLELIQACAKHGREDLPMAMAASEERLSQIERRAEELKSLVDLARGSGEALTDILESADQRSRSAMDGVDGFQQRFGEIAAAQVDEIARLRASVAALGEESTAVSERAQNELRDAIGALEGSAREALSAIETEQADRIARIAEKVGAQSAEAIDKALVEHTEEAIAELDAATARSAEAGRNIMRQLRDQLAKVNELTGNLENRIAHARDRATELVDNDFSRRVALITESLNSNAIDIAKALSTEVTDTAWASYLRGDRGIFTRRAVRLLDNTEAREIAELYDMDSDFREHVSRYIHDFEAMLRTMLSTRDGNAVSVTLLSSDMGKLYVVLAQALERLRQ